MGKPVPTPNIWDTAKNLSPNLTRFFPLLGPLATILLLLILGPCLLNCLLSFVSKRLESIKLQMVVTQGYEQLGVKPGDNHT